MRPSKAWVLCVFSALGCGLGNPELRVLPDGNVVVEVDAGKTADLGDPVDLGVTNDDGTSADRPVDDDRSVVDAGDDVVIADDVTTVDSGDVVVTTDVSDAGSDVADVPATDVADVVAVDVADAGIDVPEASDVPAAPDLPAAPDVPVMDVPAMADVPASTDVPTVPDVPSAPDVPTAPDVPPAISWHLVTGDTMYTPWRGTAPGSPEVRDCPDGQVLVGLRTWSSDYVSGMAPWCAPLTTMGTMGTATLGGRVGGTSNDNGSDDDDLCPAGELIVRFTGRSGGIIDRSQAVCAPLSTWLTTRAIGRTLRRYGDSSGGSAFEDTCPAGYVGAGFQGSTRVNFDYFRDRLGSLRLRCVRVADR